MRKIPILIVILVILVFSQAAVHAQKGGTTETRTINVNGTERTYLMHLPPDYSDPVPLVIALHGGGGNPEQFAKDTLFNDKADKEGFIVVYPRGVGLLPTWDAIHCCGPAYEQQA